LPTVTGVPVLADLQDDRLDVRERADEAFAAHDVLLAVLSM